MLLIFEGRDEPIDSMTILLCIDLAESEGGIGEQKPSLCWKCEDLVASYGAADD